MGWYIGQGSLEYIIAPYSTLYTHTHTYTHTGWYSDVIMITSNTKHLYFLSHHVKLNTSTLCY